MKGFREGVTERLWPTAHIVLLFVVQMHIGTKQSLDFADGSGLVYLNFKLYEEGYAAGEDAEKFELFKLVTTMHWIIPHYSPPLAKSILHIHSDLAFP